MIEISPRLRRWRVWQMETLLRLPATPLTCIGYPSQGVATARSVLGEMQRFVRLLRKAAKLDESGVACGQPSVASARPGRKVRVHRPNSPDGGERKWCPRFGECRCRNVLVECVSCQFAHE